MKHRPVLLAIAALSLSACPGAGDDDGGADGGPGITVGPGGPTTDDPTEGPMTAEGTSSPGTAGVTSNSASESGMPDSSGGFEPPKFDTNDMPDGGNGGGCNCGGEKTGWSYIWVANSNESTVSKIDTVTLVEEGRYSTDPSSNGNPSRTSVNLTADAVAVANRNGGVVKVWARPELCDPMRNGMAGLQTSNSSAALPFAQDDCIAWHTDFPSYTTQRPVAWTSGVQNPVTCEYEDTAVWTSGCNTGADANVWVHLLDGETGISLQDVQVPGFVCSGFGAYGGAVDSNNDFWISSNSAASMIARIRLSDFSTETVAAPHQAYGIAIDAMDRVWLTINNVSSSTDAAQRYDPATSTWDLAMGTTVKGYSGIQEGTDGRMWLNNGFGGSIGLISIDRDTLVVGPQIPIPGAVSWLNGISIDPDGNVWTVSPSADSVFRYDPGTGTIDSYSGLNFPYTYSDMTGSGLLNSTCGSPVG